MYCSKCGKEIDDSGQYCKYCGTRIEEDVPESTHARLQEDREDVPTYEMPRMIPLDMMEKHERIVYETHPSRMGTFFNHMATALLFLVVGFFLLIRFDWLIPPGLILPAALIIAGLIIALIGYLKWRSVVYALSTNRILVLKGILSKDLFENRLSKVQDIRMKISLRQRVYNCGDIFLTTAGTSGVECVWRDIPDPRKKQALLRALLAR